MNALNKFRLPSDISTYPILVEGRGYTNPELLLDQFREFFDEPLTAYNLIAGLVQVNSSGQVVLRFSEKRMPTLLGVWKYFNRKLRDLPDNKKLQIETLRMYLHGGSSFYSSKRITTKHGRTIKV